MSRLVSLPLMSANLNGSTGFGKKQMTLLYRKVAIGSDHAAIREKQELKDYLVSLGVEVNDIGAHTTDRVDYPCIASTLCGVVLAGTSEVGVLLCGTGIGVSIAANKMEGIRAGLCHNEYCARMAREHNDANVVCAGVRVLGIEVIKAILLAFLTTPFAGPGTRHADRVAMLKVSTGCS